MALSDGRRRSARPGCARVTIGRRFRSTSCASAGFWSKCFASESTYACAFGRLSGTRSLSGVSGGEVTARLTASRTSAVVPRRAGLTKSLWRRTSSCSGRSNAAVTAASASSAVIPPTATPPIVTPAAITCGSVVVPVDVVVETTPAETPPAAARPRTNKTARRTRFTAAKSLAPEDPRIVRDHRVDAKAAERTHLLGRNRRPGEHRDPERVAALDDGPADDLDVQDGRRRPGAREHPGDPAGEGRTHDSEPWPNEPGEQWPAAKPMAVVRVGQSPGQVRLFGELPQARVAERA